MSHLCSLINRPSVFEVTGEKLRSALGELQARHYDETAKLNTARTELYEVTAELTITENEKHYNALVVEHGRKAVLIAALTDELAEIELRIHDTWQ